MFHTDHREQMRDAREALEPELEGPFRFGEYDPWNDLLAVGDPVTFKNYEFPVESMREFEPRSLLGYRRGAAHIAREEYSYDLGMFDLAGCQRRIFTDYPQGKYFRAVAPGQAFDTATFGFPTEDGLERLVEDGQVTRLGPVRRRDAEECGSVSIEHATLSGMYAFVRIFNRCSPWGEEREFCHLVKWKNN